MKNILCLLFLLPLSVFAMPQDSIGTKTEGGVVYILHRVERGQTLFAIARTYNVNANEVIKANPGSDKGIQAGATLLIPTNRTATNTPTTPRETVREPVRETPVTTDRTGGVVNETRYHTVKPGDNLTRIAQQYGVSVEDIKKWNGLNNENIQVDQRLAVGPPRASLAIENKPPTPPPAATPTPPARVPTETPRNTDNNPKPTDRTSSPIPETSPQATLTNRDAIRNTKVEGNPSDEVSGTVNARQIRNVGDEIVETGTIEISSEGELAQERNFILHPSAKIGTIVMITNPNNGKSAFARVIGNYKAPAEQAAKMNPTLANKLGITSNQQVKINYAR